jgi:hypothetical protein
VQRERGADRVRRPVEHREVTVAFTALFQQVAARRGDAVFDVTHKERHDTLR